VTTLSTVTPSDDDLDAAVRRVATGTRFSGAVRVDRPHRSLEWAFGLADRRWRVPFTTGTRAGIASATKGFTAVVVMRLVETGALALDTTARSLLGGDLPLVDDGVTVEHLLAHRSGIGDYIDESAGVDVADHVMTVPVHLLDRTEAYLAVLDGFPQVAPPGERFAYNNSGFVLLALLAERATGRRFEQLVDDLVCRPAELTATGFLRSDAVPEGTATGYLLADGLRTNALHLPVLGSGDGGLSSTVADVRRFWSALCTGALVAGGSVEAMTAPRSSHGGDRYGLGFWLAPSGSVVRLEGHDAGVSFSSSHDPVTDVTHTVIGNWSEAAWPVAQALCDLLG
jgi:CubicO group peptidase (beta-lactamase class C family)